jgi:hypothetical protein
MLDTRRILYAAGPIGFAFELYETKEYDPDPVGIASWMVANSAAMYAATSFANHSSVGGQTVWSVYSPVIKEEAANLGRIIRGPKPPPSAFMTLGVGLHLANIAKDLFRSDVPDLA